MIRCKRQLTKNNAEMLQKILEERGYKVASLTEKALLEGVESKVLREPLQYLVDHRRDVIRPTLMSLACESVGGNPDDVLDAAVAMVLVCYHIGFIDDVIDETKVKRLARTLPGRFGVDVSLMSSIILKAKAYFILSQLSRKLDSARFIEVNRIFRDFLIRMGEGETLNIQAKREGIVDTQRLIEVFQMESADIEACTKIGAIIGNGTKEEVEALSQYGRILGTQFLLREDIMDSLNFSIQLGNKLIRRSYPFPVLWGINNSDKFRDFISTLKKKKKLTPSEIKKCVQLLFESGSIDYVTKLIEKLAGNAVGSLKEIKENEAKKMLEWFARVQSQIVFEMFSE